MSTQEKLFKVLVSELICTKMDLSEERENRLINFYNQAEYYYDTFCEAVYLLMTNDNIETISLDDFGYAHFNHIGDNNLIGHALLSKEDIINPSDDIILYIKLALRRLEARLQRLSLPPDVVEIEDPGSFRMKTTCKQPVWKNNWRKPRKVTL